MAGCITKDLKDLLISLLEAEVPPLTLKMVVEKSFPACAGEEGPAKEKSTTSASASARTMPAHWPTARFIDENGNASDYNSPSELYVKLTGKKLSGSICTSPEHHPPICYPATTVESFRIWGYIVQGNGEDPPPSDPANWLHSNNVSRDSVIDATNIWKEHLKATGKKFIVIDPKWVKKQAEKAGIE